MGYIPELIPQAGETDIEERTVESTQEALTDFHSHETQVVAERSNQIESSRYDTSVSGDSIDKFFERPLLLGSWQWQVGSGLDVLVYPWKLWAENKRVANRLANYANFKGRMHIKIVLNGNPFYWGRAFASYTMYNSSPYIGYENTWLDIMPATQRPHIWINSTTSQGGEMILPFFHPQDCLDVQSINEFEKMGILWLRSVASLRHANGSTQPISIQMFGWVDDISLSTLTQNVVPALTPQAGLVPQSGEAEEGGPISKPASAVAKVANTLASAPVIGPYALATETMAKAVGSVARIFGYSRPRVLDPPKPMVVQQVGNLASTDMDEVVGTLALTSKQEVSIDPRIVGLDGTDEMSFGYLAQKSTYFAQCLWALSRTLNYPLLSIGVSPFAASRDNRVLVPATKNGYAVSAMTLASLPFMYWRGTITYKFQVVCSAYHRGRLLVTWEPRGSPSPTPELNTLQSTIIDISETTEFEIKVGWGAKTAGLRVLDLKRADTYGNDANRYAAGRLIDPIPDTENGTLNLYVLNDLVTSGSDTNSIKILVSAHSDDLELWSPRQSNISDITYDAPVAVAQLDPQSGKVGPEVTSVTFGNTKSQAIPSICSGETITSFRALLKRYALKRIYMLNGGVPATQQMMPILRGSSFLGQHYEEDIGMDVQAYVINCFAGWRGSTRHRYVPAMINRSKDLVSHQAFVTRNPGEKWLVAQQNFNNNSKPDLGARYKTYVQFGSGGAISKTADTDVVEFEQPYYDYQRFQTNNDDTNTDLSHAYTSIITNSDPTNTVRIAHRVHHFTAIGDDFGLHGYLGPPGMWTV